MGGRDSPRKEVYDSDTGETYSSLDVGCGHGYSRDEGLESVRRIAETVAPQLGNIEVETNKVIAERNMLEQPGTC